MKKLLVLITLVVLTMASAMAQTTAGYVPEFTNSSGSVANSAIFQLGSNIGIGTTSPLFNLHVTSTTDPAAVVVEGIGHVGANFIGLRAEGTPGSLSGVLANDNLFTLQGRGYGSTGFSSGSRAYLKMFANENWTDTVQSTYITFGTTPAGSKNIVERMRIDNAGNLGINTTTPGGAPTLPLAPPVVLEVNGNLKMTAGSGGGITFGDGTVQTTAFTGTAGVALSSPDGSVTVGGTATAPTVKVNTAIIQASVTGTCPAGSAMTAVNANGAVVCGTVGSGGTLASVSIIVAQTSFTGSYGLGGTNTVYTADEDAFYRVSVYMNVPTTGTCGTTPCAGEAITLQWSDGVSTTALATANCNLVTPCGSSAVTPIWVASGQTITAYGQSYGTGTAPSGGSYNAYLLVEKLKK